MFSRRGMLGIGKQAQLCVGQQPIQTSWYLNREEIIAIPMGDQDWRADPPQFLRLGKVLGMGVGVEADPGLGHNAPMVWSQRCMTGLHCPPLVRAGEDRVGG